MLFIYKSLINLLYPVFIIIIFLRIFFKKESKTRYREKLFSSSFNAKKNFKKKLIWFHVASIGEFNSIVPIINRLNNKKIYQILITSVTLSSSHLISEKFSNKKNILHRFFPLDKDYLVKEFLKKWSPDLIFFVDSEIWPNFLIEIKNNNIPLILLNGRITKKTFKRWMLIKSFAVKVFNSFNLCFASNKESEKYLKIFKAKRIKFVGNLKFSTIINKKNIFSTNETFLKKNKFWCAASTHRGEEIFCINTHLELKKKYKNIVTIIIPRHVDRSREILSLCKKNNLNTHLLNNKEKIDKKSEIIIINSFGNLLGYYKYTSSVFIGKSSLVKFKSNGGQNPIEAAKLGCRVYHGPYVSNFSEIYKFLRNYGICNEVKSEKELSTKIFYDLKKNKSNKIKIVSFINKLGETILKKSLSEISKVYKI